MTSQYYMLRRTNDISFDHDSLFKLLAICCQKMQCMTLTMKMIHYYRDRGSTAKYVFLKPTNRI